MPPQKGGFLLFQILRIDRDIFLFPAQDTKFSVKLEILRQFPCYLLRFIVTLQCFGILMPDTSFIHDQKK